MCSSLAHLSSSVTSIKNNYCEEMLASNIRIELTSQEQDYLRNISHQVSEDSSEAFDVLRWCHAYNGDLETAAKKLKRHLRIRQILKLDSILSPNSGHEIDEFAESYAPLHYIGNTHVSEGGGLHAVFLEQSGLFDFSRIMETIQLSPFMLNRFRNMERIVKEIRAIEKSSKRMSAAILVLDLKGLSFQPNLISFISGTYRIMWGTLMEQYAFIFKKFLIVNAPSFMGLLWSACSAFVPSEYREKIHLLNTSNDDYSKLHEHVNPHILPPEYGGYGQFQIQKPTECNVPKVLENTQLDTVHVSAGKSMVQTYYLLEDQELQCYLLNSQEFTLNIFYSPDKKILKNPQKDSEELEEVFAGCERPGLPTLDCWKWIVPSTGFYYVVFGNEKAWLMGVSLGFQLFQMHPNGSKIKVNPIPN